MPDEQINVEAALEALARVGLWTGPPLVTAELVRVELRRAARVRGIRVRTGIGSRGHLYACTPDGLPGEEPWRGAAQHAHDSGVAREVANDALDRFRSALQRPRP